MGPDGVIVPLELGSLVDDVRAAEVEAVAVCLLFSFLHPEHERLVGEALRELGVPVSLSCELLPEFREYERCSTVVANAYLRPALSGYLREIEPEPLVMQSSGGVVDAATASERAAACVLSGPAAGVAGAAFVAGDSGVLTFDMGGTSTDVSAVAQVTADSVVAGVAIRFPTMDVHTIGAGGGSIAWLDDGGALRVGPRSAGASPGPACYGRGGVEPTVTDAHLALGHLADGAVLGGEVKLDRGAALRALRDLDPAGVIEVVNANMARALRVVSVERGIDPRGLTLVAFGGAGPLHACALAEELGIERILVPFASGMLSALGLAVADLRRDYVGGTFAEMEAQAAVDLPGAAVARFVDARYPGQSHELTIEDGADFHAAHERRYGFRLDSEPQVVTRRVVATLVRPLPELESLRPSVSETVAGPTIVELPGSTCLVAPGWTAEPDASGTLELRWTP
jgi:N-methylhydantoinase A